MVSAMPKIANPYYDIYATEGEEVSSTFEGRHVLIAEGDLVHVDTGGDGLVNKGQPVSFGQSWLGQGVGIALKSAESINDAVPVDTEGIWRCKVSSLYGMVVGQIVFIDAVGNLIDWPVDGSEHVFGYTLQPIAAPANGDPTVETVAVKVHWMDTGIWWYFFLLQWQRE
jgi:hypothetical protein